MSHAPDLNALDDLVRRLETTMDQPAMASLCTPSLETLEPLCQTNRDSSNEVSGESVLDLARLDAIVSRLERAAAIVVPGWNKAPHCANISTGCKAAAHGSPSLLEQLQRRSSTLHKVSASDQHISSVGCIDEPMHQICLTDNFEREKSECWQNSLYLGGFSGANMHDALRVRSIRTVLSILHDAAPILKPMPGVDYWRSPGIEDESNSRASLALSSVLDDVHARIDAGLCNGSVLVHCMMGISRSGTAVASYVMKKLCVGSDAALERVRQCRRVARPNHAFTRLLKQLEVTYCIPPVVPEIETQLPGVRSEHQVAVVDAAKAIHQADYLLIASGAGLSAESGLPTFATMTEKLGSALGPGVSYDQAAAVDTMAKDPTLFYGFWFTSAHNYAKAEAHAGYDVLRQWRKLKESCQSHGANGVRPVFALTSNVDGFLKRIGFSSPETLAQIHGSMEKWQCGGVPSGTRFPLFKTERCSEELFDPPPHDSTDYERLRHAGPPPTCPRCGDGWLRPHVYLFGDGNRFADREEETGQKSFAAWHRDVLASLRAMPNKRLAIIEIGCGLRVPNIRKRSEELLAACPAGQAVLIRLNPEVSEQQFAAKASIVLRSTALKGLQDINTELLRL
eukprot:TRINITY_DN24112_c0_g2_i1.p1 TRINITY_DN24112_c0_g2~~TRINITY_DN24112_c0_g2_i1.p1  ORF type:complete len:637 (-),score=111.43 TRINITY_DN24112_c0_g2_i1:113-1984(-)